jgi:methanogenic corrinoid protein MtbC1
MQSDMRNVSAVPERKPEGRREQRRVATPVWSSLVAHNNAAKEHIARLALAIEADVIPRLVQAHRAPQTSVNALSVLPTVPAEQVASFVQLIIGDNEAGIQTAVAEHRRAGLTVETLCLDLFAPAARQLGELWDDDICDFAAVTVGLGRLQRLLRELNPAFGAEVEHPTNGRRALFAQPADEQHSFGLSMVAEFFRREGWDVAVAAGRAAEDPATRLGREWFDLVGFSIGCEKRLEWLRERIGVVRTTSRNPDVVVLVGGPLFALNPAFVTQVGADGTANDAKEAPRVAARMLLTMGKQA